MKKFLYLLLLSLAGMATLAGCDKDDKEEKTTSIVIYVNYGTDGMAVYLIDSKLYDAAGGLSDSLIPEAECVATSDTKTYSGVNKSRARFYNVNPGTYAVCYKQTNYNGTYEYKGAGYVTVGEGEIVSYTISI